MATHESDFACDGRTSNTFYLHSELCAAIFPFSIFLYLLLLLSSFSIFQGSTIFRGVSIMIQAKMALQICLRNNFDVSLLRIFKDSISNFLASSLSSSWIPVLKISTMLHFQSRTDPHFGAVLVMNRDQMALKICVSNSTIYHQGYLYKALTVLKPPI